MFVSFSVVINFIVYGALNHLCNDRNGYKGDLQSKRIPGFLRSYFFKSSKLGKLV